MNDRVSFPARPMPDARRHGGNKDDNSNALDATVRLPVVHSGGLLGLGDVHASMDDGEISGTGIEIRETALVRVELVMGVASARSVTENAHSIVTYGTAQFCHPCPGTEIARMSFPKLSSNPTTFAFV